MEFDGLALTVTKRINAKYGTHGEKEDALQEALIRAWKDHQEGSYDFNHMVNRAENWARKYLFPGSNAQKATGSTRVDTSGFVRKPELREKIRLFMDEYLRLHGKKPSQATVAKSLGMTQSSVSYYLKRMSNGGTTPIKTKDGSRIDYGAYRSVALEDITGYGENKDSDYNYRIPTDGFESSLMADLHFQQILNGYDLEMQQILVLYCECDWTFKDIGLYLWPDLSWTAARSKAQRIFYKAKAQLEKDLMT
ncbi:MAG: hypothetical protein ABR585_12890 [Gemmatimonadaceae bacterium]|nr:hypothetical protein [Actinomycetota bacterium]